MYNQIIIATIKSCFVCYVTIGITCYSENVPNHKKNFKKTCFDKYIVSS